MKKLYTDNIITNHYNQESGAVEAMTSNRSTKDAILKKRGSGSGQESSSVVDDMQPLSLTEELQKDNQS